MTRALVLLCALVACKPHSHGAARLEKAGDSEADFAAQLDTAIGRDLVFDESKHALTGSNEYISTTNIYAEWQKTPAAERPAALEKIAAGFKQTADEKLDWATVQPRLMPAVRAISYFDTSRLPQVGSGKMPESIPHVMLGYGAAVGIAIDSPDAMAIATDKDFADWKVTPEQALSIAVRNLGAGGAHFVQLEPGVWGAQEHDSYDASRVLLVDEIKKLDLPGGAVAMIPNRETLLLAGAKDAKGLLAMAARAEAVESDPRPIHALALCLADDGWHECVPDASREVKKKYSLMNARSWKDLYDDGHDTYQDKLGDDLFVAHLMAVEKPDGSGVSYATWTKTVPTMLPKADMVAFVVLTGPEGAEKGKMLGVAPWDRVMAVCGAHLSETGALPRYWATGDWFPTDDDLKKLALTAKP
jgi:hypothetical protein